MVKILIHGKIRPQNAPKFLNVKTVNHVIVTLQIVQLPINYSVYFYSPNSGKQVDEIPENAVLIEVTAGIAPGS